jgi:hypothetical protein
MKQSIVTIGAEKQQPFGENEIQIYAPFLWKNKPEIKYPQFKRLLFLTVNDGK